MCLHCLAVDPAMMMLLLCTAQEVYARQATSLVRESEGVSNHHVIYLQSSLMIMLDYLMYRCDHMNRLVQLKHILQAKRQSSHLVFSYDSRRKSSCNS